MAKIFLSFFNGVPKLDDLDGLPPFYDSFIKGLVDNGNEVLVYQTGKSIRDNAVRMMIGQRLKSELNRFAPDLVIAFNNFGYDYAKMVDCPILIYGVDSPKYYSNQDMLARDPQRFRYLVADGYEVEHLQQTFKLPKGYVGLAPFFTEIYPEDLEKTVPISFIGSRFAHKSFPWNEFRQRRPDYASAQKYLQLVNELRKNPYAEATGLDERYGDLGLSADDYAVIVGALAAERRIQILSSVADLGLELFGPEEWFYYGGESADLYCSYNPQRLYTRKQNQDLYNSSKICLNVNHIYSIEGFSWRVCDIMASSGCLVSEWTPNLTKYFPQVPIPMFRNKYEAHEQCAKVLKDDKLRAEVVAASQQAIDERFRFRHVLPIIEELCGLTLRSPDPGKVEFLRVGSNDTLIKPPTKFKLVCSLAKLILEQIPMMQRKGKEAKLLGRIEHYYMAAGNSKMLEVRKQMWQLPKNSKGAEK